MRCSILKSRFLRSTALVVAATASFAVPASAQQANLTPANVNVLNLLSPFLTLNSTPVGQQTLQTNLSQAVAINQNASSAALLNNNLTTSALAALAISDENSLGSASNTVYGIATSTNFGVAANLAGGLPTENTTSYGTAVNGSQTIGGFGSILGAAYVKGVNPSNTTLPKTVSLLTTAFGFTGNTLATGDSQVAKFYFANGTWNGTTTAVAPTGSTAPTSGGLPNGNNSVYDTAYNVTNKQSGQNAYGDSHPYQTYSHIPGATYTLYDPTVKTAYSASAYPGAVNPDKPSSNPAFPSSHMAYAMTDSVLLGMLTPSLYQSMLVRASAMGESRIVVGVHYPLDIIGSRAFTYYDLANYLSNPAYINNATTTGTAVNLPSLMGAAQPELTSQLTAAAAAASCGTSLATCATSAANVNPYAPTTSNNAVYAARMTYGLPTSGAAPERTDTLGQDATILLATVFGGNSAAATSLLGQLGLTTGMYGNLRTATIQQVIANTESAQITAFAGTQLSYWSRINLEAAIGYFSNVTGTLNTAAGDTLTTGVTIASGGVVNVTGLLTIDAALTENAGGALGFVLGGVTPQIDVSGAVLLDGQLDLTLGAGFALTTGEIFDLVAAGGPLTENISALFFDGSACANIGGGAFSCADGGRSITFDLLSSGGGQFDVKVGSVPEPSTWALMLAGFAGLGLAGYRGRRKAEGVAA